jgi:hypothetical protein
MKYAKQGSRNPGALYITLAGEYLGLISSDGRARGRFTQMPDVLERLSAIVAEPAFEAKRYAVLMCRCSFCGLPLTDDGSVLMGYGPICARNYDLPHIALGTATPKEVRA